MPSIFSLIGQSWNFTRKQPILLSTGFWMIFLPILIMELLSNYLHSVQNNVTGNDVIGVLLAALGIILLTIVTIWGSACVILIGSRLLAAKSGRSRTSFAAVRSEAKTSIIPLLLTNILRVVFSLLWGILLIIPGIIYALNTSFYAVIVVTEGISYRKALRLSSAMMRGQRVMVYWKIIAISLLLFVPTSIITGLISAIPAPGIVYISAVIGNALHALALILFSMSMILLYGSLKPSTKPITGGGKKAASKKKK